jgi:hypothetical protein
MEDDLAAIPELPRLFGNIVQLFEEKKPTRNGGQNPITGKGRRHTFISITLVQA